MLVTDIAKMRTNIRLGKTISQVTALMTETPPLSLNKAAHVAIQLRCTALFCSLSLALLCDEESNL